MGSIIEHSSFPDAVTMHGHDAWWYNEPGAVGFANPDFESFEGPGLLARIERLVARHSDEKDQGAEGNLRSLSMEIEHTLEELDTGEDPRRAEYFSQIRELERELEAYEVVQEPIRRLFGMFTFVSVYNLEWYVIG